MHSLTILGTAVTWTDSLCLASHWKYWKPGVQIYINKIIHLLKTKLWISNFQDFIPYTDMHTCILTDRKTDMHIYVVVNTLSKISLKHTGFCFYTVEYCVYSPAKFWILNLKMCIQWYWPRQWDILLES